MLVTDDFYIGMELPIDPAKVRRTWIAALRAEKYPRGTDRCLAMRGERCVFGVLCEVCQSMGLITLQSYEWDFELPPYSVLMLAGVRFDTVRARQASGMDVDEILQYADYPGRTHRESGIAIEQMFEQRVGGSPFHSVWYEATPGLGGNGETSGDWYTIAPPADEE